MVKIEALPNYCNGKLYKRWSSVFNAYGKGSIIASKKGNKGITQLLITEDGNRRELFTSNGKIMETITPNGIKRVYKYQRKQDGTIKGAMTASKDLKGQNPFILSAKWILKNMIPEEIQIKFNNKHPKSRILIINGNSAKISYDTEGKNNIQLQEILAKDFDNSYYPLPKTIVIKTTKGETKTITGQTQKDNMKIAQSLGIESEELGAYFRTIV